MLSISFMFEVPLKMTNPSIDLKQPILAGVLAFLVPGAGHLYQGRLFKAGIYSFCILGLFFSGMAMADWQAVKPPPRVKRGLLDKAKYAGQLGVGLPAMYGIIQRERYASPANRPPETIPSPITATFSGRVVYHDQTMDDFEGEIELVPAKAPYGGRTIAGTLTGEFQGEQRTFTLSPSVNLGQPIQASPERQVEAELIEEREGRSESAGYILGNIPRRFGDWFQVPMEEEEVQELHRRLGKYHEVAMVFTWIAGFLNVLAVWDAVEGPAYGYDDSHETGESSEEKKETA